MEAAGFTPADYETDPVDLWPENWEVFQFFSGRLGTQWRFGPAGPTGLDYSPAFVLMDRMNLQGRAWDDFFSDLQHLEQQALAAMNAD